MAKNGNNWGTYAPQGGGGSRWWLVFTKRSEMHVENANRFLARVQK